jgi:hypothetical protein
MLLVIPQLMRLLEPTLHGSGMAEALAALGNGLSSVVVPIGLMVSMAISMLIIPKRPPHRSPIERVKFVAEWFLVPVVLLAFMCLPAIDAQTRLIFRRYMGFRVTVKNRRARAHEVY